ncbi:MAG: PAS domain-containing protein [Pseudomonadota bacterium]
MSLRDGRSHLTERQKELVEYWKSKSTDGKWPCRSDINPGDVLSALASISLIERDEDGFRFRLTGSSLRSVFGGNVQGQLIREIDVAVEEAGSASLEVTLENGHPVCGSRKMGDRWHIWLRLPLLDETGDPRLVLCSDEVVAADPDKVGCSSYAKFDYGRQAA